LERIVMSRHFFVIVFLACFALGSGFAQEEGILEDATPEFRGGVELVDVDAVVVDKKGEPVRGLTAADFAIEEDGVPQEIVRFEAVELPDEPVTDIPERPRVSRNTDERAETGRTFVVLFDDIHLTLFQGERAKSAVVEFLKQGTRPGDNVSLVAAGGGTWWTTRMPHGQKELVELVGRLDGRNIRLYSGRDQLSEYEALRIHVYRDAEVYGRVHRRFDTYGVNPNAGSDQGGSQNALGGGFEDPLVYGRAAEVYYDSLSKNRVTLDMLTRLLNGLESTAGRKSVILVSEGFIYDPNIREFKEVKEASRRSNAPVYFLDTRGLAGLPVYATAEVGPSMEASDVGRTFLDTLDASEGSESIAADTGGFTVKNTNDLAEGLRRIADDSRNYYILGYLPKSTERDGKFRKISVEVDRPKVKVRARKGYYAPRDESDDSKKPDSGADPQLQAALDSPWPIGDVPLRMTAAVFEETLRGKARTLVVTEIDLRQFAFDKRADATSGVVSGYRFTDAVEFFLVVAHRQSGEYFEYNQKVEMKLREETLQRMGAQWFPISREFELAPGHYQAKIVVRDANSKLVGTVVHEFDVPELGVLRTSSPIVTDSLQDEDAATPKPRLVVRREFPNDGMLFSQYEVYGAALDADTTMPRVRASHEVRRIEDGAVHTRAQMSQIRPTSLGNLSRMNGTRLDGAPPGDYEVVIELKDDVSGQTLEIREPFRLVEPSEAKLEFVNIRPGSPLGITLDKFETLQNGMSYEAVRDILGDDGLEENRTTVGTTTTVIYSWSNRNESKLTGTFANGLLIEKTQQDLPTLPAG
jgi:VWFA-related protein